MSVSSAISIEWSATPDATHWNTYRGSIPAMMMGSLLPGAVYDHACFESGDAGGDGPTVSSDGSIPPVGTAYYYLVSGEAGGCESTLGQTSSGAAIPASPPCPTPP